MVHTQTQADTSDYPSMSRRRASSSHGSLDRHSHETLTGPVESPSHIGSPSRTGNPHRPSDITEWLQTNQSLASSSRESPGSRQRRHSNEFDYTPPDSGHHNAAEEDDQENDFWANRGLEEGGSEDFAMELALLRSYRTETSPARSDDLSRAGLLSSRRRRRPSGPSLKRTRANFERVDSKDIMETLNKKGAVVALIYRNGVHDPNANDIWPNFRNEERVPAHYSLFKRPDPSAWPAPEASPEEVFKEWLFRPLSRVSADGSEPRSPPPKMLKTYTAPVPKKTSVGQEKVPVCSGSRPQWRLPIEMVELIASYLDRDDIKSMRLVSKELNHYTSEVLFKTVVVPFNTEIYGMLGNEANSYIKGKNKVGNGVPSYVWNSKEDDDVYNGHGLDVFRGFGRHILRYGMSFEINEDAWANAPEKCLTQKHKSFWGTYNWPFEEYRRFDVVAGLETTADETPRMTIAFSELSKVKELALSIDSGLGWLNGPDRSIRARILQRPLEVFGTQKDVPDRRSQAQEELWEHMEASYWAAEEDITVATLFKFEDVRLPSSMHDAIAAADHQPEMPFLDANVIQQAFSQDKGDLLNPPPSLDDSSFTAGILFSAPMQPGDESQAKSPIMPSNLTNAQKEWLLETEWAQRAFMSSYMLSVIDNPTTFRAVHTLNIPRMSDCYIPLLNRADFWDGLPSLKCVTMLVIPSWRQVNKDKAGYVETPRANPEGAIDTFYDILSRMISRRSNITKLTIGWATGGEHAEGLFARNKLLLPAPLLLHRDILDQDAENLRNTLLQLPYVEDLTLKNCWTTPLALTEFVNIHDKLQLKKLTLDSVSLTAAVRPLSNLHQQNPPAPPLMQLGAQWQLFQRLQSAVQNHGTTRRQRQALVIHIQALQVHVQHMLQQAGPHLQGQLQTIQNQLQTQLQVVSQQNLAQNVTSNQADNPTQTASAATDPNQTSAMAALININNVSNLFVQINQIHQQLQAQLQQPHQQQQLHQLWHLMAHPGAQPVAQPAFQPAAQNQQLAPDPLAALKTKPRAGSWMDTIDIITPGPNLSDFGSNFSNAADDRKTKLQSIEFISCGYTYLTSARIEQPGVAKPQPYDNPAIAKRYSLLLGAMLQSKYELLGTIVQNIDATELLALNAGWFMETGWKNTEEARAVEFDGLLPGGTGRFSGRVRRQDRVQTDGS